MGQPGRDRITPCARAAIVAYEARQAWLRARAAGAPDAQALHRAWLGRLEQLRHEVVRWMRG